MNGIFVDGDADTGTLYAKVILAPRGALALVGRTAGELRAMGCRIDTEVPDCAELKPSGQFEWYTLDINYKIEMR
jgi:hypothetical protein